MKKGTRIINCARGGIVDEDALADAIESGHIAGAAVDVFVNEPPGETRLTSLPQVLCTPHLGASTDEAQELVAVEAAEIIAAFLLRNEIRHAVNMVPISGAEMADMKQYLNLGHRLGLLLAQLNKSGNVRSARLQYRGEVATKKTDLITSAFAAGLLETALDESVNIVNAPMLAQDRGIEIDESKSSDHGNFSTLVSATLATDHGEITAAGTLFGTEFLRLVRLDQFHLDAYLDGLLLIYRHRDMPGQIGYIGMVFGKHGVNIAHMALGRETNEPGGPSVAVLNLDNEPSDEALKDIASHHDVTGVDLVHLPPAVPRCPGSSGNRIFEKPGLRKRCSRYNARVISSRPDAPNPEERRMRKRLALYSVICFALLPSLCRGQQIPEPPDSAKTVARYAAESFIAGCRVLPKPLHEDPYFGSLPFHAYLPEPVSLGRLYGMGVEELAVLCGPVSKDEPHAKIHRGLQWAAAARLAKPFELRKVMRKWHESLVPPRGECPQSRTRSTGSIQLLSRSRWEFFPSSAGIRHAAIPG